MTAVLDATPRRRSDDRPRGWQAVAVTALGFPGPRLVTANNQEVQKRVFPDVIQLRISRWGPLGFRVGLAFSDGVLMRDEGEMQSPGTLRRGGHAATHPADRRGAVC